MKRNTGKIQRTLGDKKQKRELLEEENCWDGPQQENYLDGWIKGTIKSTGQGQKEIGDNRKEERQEGEEP